MDDLQPSVEMLDERGAAFHPIAIVAVQHPADIANLGVVNMPADDAVKIAAARFVRQHLDELADVLHRVLDLQLQKGRQRPILIAEQAPAFVEVMVQPQRQRIGAVAGHRSQRAFLTTASKWSP